MVIRTGEVIDDHIAFVAKERGLYQAVVHGVFRGKFELIRDEKIRGLEY